MRKLILLSLLTYIGFLVGCASPKSSIALDSGAKKFQPELGKSSIYINRESAIEFVGMGFKTYLDGKNIGSLGTGEFLLVYVAPGEHTLVVHATMDLRLKFNTEPGKNYFFDISLNFGVFISHIYLKQIGEEEGQKKVSVSKRLEAVNQ
jgi:hypothetical protein